MSTLRERQELWRLKSLVEEAKSGSLPMNRLEEEFLYFSAYTTKPLLVVETPKLYTLAGDEPRHYATALHVLGIKEKVPHAVDITGAFDATTMTNELLFVSPLQLDADYLTKRRVHLMPLIEKVYSDGAGLVRDFGLHEVVIGKATCHRNGLALAEIGLFPERFTRGTYTLSVTLDTPAQSISKFMNLKNDLSQFDNPRKMLDATHVERTAQRAIELRKMLGTLSRYEVPLTQTFSVETNSCTDGTHYYLCNNIEGKIQNILLAFDDIQWKIPRQLTVIDARIQQDALAQLVRAGLYIPSNNILSQRINDLTLLYENTLRQTGAGDHQDVEALLEKLRDAQTYLSSILNDEVKREWACRQPYELLEFMVHPAQHDPVLHDLLPRLSWNNNLRSYHDTIAFVTQFEKENDDGKKKQLSQIMSSLLFLNQQNKDVNYWLYTNHKQACLDHGIRFDIR